MASVTSLRLMTATTTPRTRVAPGRQRAAAAVQLCCLSVCVCVCVLLLLSEWARVCAMLRPLFAVTNIAHHRTSHTDPDTQQAKRQNHTKVTHTRRRVRKRNITCRAHAMNGHRARMHARSHSDTHGKEAPHTHTHSLNC